MMSRHLRLNGIVLCAALASACAQLPGPDPSPGPGGEPHAAPLRDVLPAELVALREDGLVLRGERVVFDGEFDFPPRLKGVAATSDLRLDIVPGVRPSRAESLQSMRSMALANPRVSAALGERYALLRSGWLDDDKEAAAASSQRYQLTFYSYARNEIVTVITERGREVTDVRSQAAQVQPAESREEVDAAIEIVRRDDRFGPMVKDLRGRGILTPGPGRDRSLYLMFYRAARTPALFEATVNMSTGKVVDARPLR
jgi:hypothetical protein